MIYYVDRINGNDKFDGLSPEQARKNYTDLPVAAGDSVLFKCGTFMRERLHVVNGEEGNPVTYSAYGEGEKPVFCGSIDMSSEANWKEVQKSVWKCQAEPISEVCNFIFNHGESCGALRWNANELETQGDWNDSGFGIIGENSNQHRHEVFIYSTQNPGAYYTHIECVVRTARNMADCKHDVHFKNLSFINSGIHGISGVGTNNVISGCEFKFIGGAVWDLEQEIRFGNAVEFWNVAENVVVENCFFDNIYDSCVTHQGSEQCKPAKHVKFMRNLFMNYGMAAYELRDVMPIDASFTDNICVNAGHGFSKLGAAMPRNSEIWPEPMGHHVFLWRVEKATKGGGLEISGNVFYNAPVGAAVYSRISGEAELQMSMQSNTYYSENKSLLNRFGGRNYPEFDVYRTATGQDSDSKFEMPDIDSLIERWKMGKR